MILLYWILDLEFRLCIWIGGTDSKLAKRHGITTDEAQRMVRDLCRDLPMNFAPAEQIVRYQLARGGTVDEVRARSADMIQAREAAKARKLIDKSTT